MYLEFAKYIRYYGEPTTRLKLKDAIWFALRYYGNESEFNKIDKNYKPIGYLTRTKAEAIEKCKIS